MTYLFVNRKYIMFIISSQLYVRCNIGPQSRDVELFYSFIMIISFERNLLLFFGELFKQKKFPLSFIFVSAAHFFLSVNSHLSVDSAQMLLARKREREREKTLNFFHFLQFLLLRHFDFSLQYSSARILSSTKQERHMCVMESAN